MAFVLIGLTALPKWEVGLGRLFHSVWHWSLLVA